jgi:membrane-associated phospholipid phosphatase
VTELTDPVSVSAPHAAAAPQQPRSRRRLAVLVAVWVALFAAAVVADRPVATLVDRYQPIPAKRKKPPGVTLIKMAGDFRYLSVVLVAGAVVHRAKWRAGAMLLTSCALSGAFYGTKWVFGRHRPSFVLEPFTFTPFKDGFPGIVYAQYMSFPSGHACLSFAAASGLTVLFPRWWWAFYAVALILGVQRVLEGAHYPSDVVAGAGFGMLSTCLAVRLARGWFGAEWLKPAEPAEPAVVATRPASP